MELRERLKRRARSWRDAGRDTSDYWLVRFLFLRTLGTVYFFAFLSLVLQLDPLLGSSGLTPAAAYLDAVATVYGGGLEALWNVPTVFWLNSSDAFMMSMAALGLVLSAAAMLGLCNSISLAANWIIYLSFVSVGQVWYGYGWESQLLETGFLAIFLAPALDPRPLNPDSPPPRPVLWLLQWLAVRVHLGSGLIKLKGSPCWRELTCLQRYFETQPIPNPVSPWMHHLPAPVLKLGAAATHAVQLLAPLTFIGGLADRSWRETGRKIRLTGGVAMIGLQLAMILTGNLSFLNWLTVAAAFSFLDDRFLSRLFPEFLVERADMAREAAGDLSLRREAVSWLLVAAVALLSIPVVMNLFAGSQAMNASFNQFHLVNTYGAFGSVRPHRTELVVQGSRGGEWESYDFRFKPDQADDPLPVVAPYQPRMAWQMWFASMSSPERQPWLMHWVWKELGNESSAGRIVADDPFGQRPPDRLRILRYRYEYRKPWTRGPTWNRTDRELWLPPVSRRSQGLRRYIRGSFRTVYG